MYKVLIVDDEKMIRIGIQAMITREFPDDFLTETACDGQEALEKIAETPIDLLITDIRMPRMDGIQLIKTLHEREDRHQIIILSGYDDFIYAKEAIKCKVNDYLLKPVNRNEFFSALKKVIKELESQPKQDDQFLEEYRTSQLNYLILNPNMHSQDLNQLFAKMKMAPYPEGYYIGIIDSKRNIEGVDFLKYLTQFIQSNTNREDDKTVVFLDKDERIVVIAENLDLFSTIREQLGKDKQIAFSIGLSEKATEMKEFRNTYKQAEHALKYYFLYPRSKFILFETVKNKSESMEIPTESIGKISNMLGTDRDQEIRALLLGIFDFEKITTHSIRYIEMLSKEINYNLFESFFSKMGEESSETFKMFNKIGNIYNFEDYYDYFHALEDLLIRFHEYHKQMKSVYAEKNYMENAINYIKGNYHKDLNLAVVSNYISLNYSYFSHMFKEYTGKNFVDYLKMVRVEAAVNLLNEGKYKVFEISEMVGYKNPKQFARVFREIKGISPKEYREQRGGTGF